ncbi:TROVE domain-containing protein [Kordia algicida OT-1]|uniref:TROVE domain-containing protein n=1 Tax=Kordia algicida OT-1 TaxID=391587 RepID=A9DKB7_9FLAO|nr:TROVE domain-containing protein [Kordia algicida]EDP98294.1 hypothetical protein KAOT1_13792 [Kordia algicida OT-1]
MKFNVFTKKRTQVITNHQGEKAYKMTPEMELYSAVVTTSLEKTTYENTSDRVKRIQKLVRNCDPVFVAKLAVYARTKMNLRSIPVVLAVELGKIHKGDNLVSKTIYNIVQRADEITEVLAYYQTANKRNGVKKLNRLSKQVQKGIAKAFTKFDEYQFAKYNRKGDVTLKDALFLTHPKATSEDQQYIFNKIVNNNLETPYTWEVELSKVGQQYFASAEAKREAVKATWETLIYSKKVGYMAIMRNLRNILQADVSPDCISQVANYLSNEQAVLRSRQLPFRFLSAYNEIQLINSPYTSYILEALEDAIQISAQNIQGFDIHTRVLMACDVSGSMFSPVSKKSKIQCYDIGLVLAMLLQNRSNNTITGIFGDRWMPYNLPKKGILRNVTALKKIEGKVGYATNGYKVIEYLNQNKKVMDKVFFFTDLQMWNSNYRNNNHIQKEWLKYKRNVAPHAKLYLFDLMGHGQAPLRIEQNDVHLIAGWSDKVFEVMHAIENGNKALSEIKKIKFE